MGPGRDRTRDPLICSQTRICCQTYYRLRYAARCNLWPLSIYNGALNTVHPHSWPNCIKLYGKVHWSINKKEITGQDWLIVWKQLNSVCTYIVEYSILAAENIFFLKVVFHFLRWARIFTCTRCQNIFCFAVDAVIACAVRSSQPLPF